MLVRKKDALQIHFLFYGPLFDQIISLDFLNPTAQKTDGFLDIYDLWEHMTQTTFEPKYFKKSDNDHGVNLK